MTRQILIVVGAALLSIGGIGLIVGVVWLVSSNVLGTLPYILEARFDNAALSIAGLAAGGRYCRSLLHGKRPGTRTEAAAH